MAYLYYSHFRGQSQGFKISNSCQSILHGLSATVCESPVDLSTTSIHLSTVALNATNAGALQFTVGRTFCNVDESGGTTTSSNANITVFYGQLPSSYDAECANWTILQTIRYS